MSRPHLAAALGGVALLFAAGAAPAPQLTATFAANAANAANATAATAAAANALDVAIGAPITVAGFARYVDVTSPVDVAFHLEEGTTAGLAGTPGAWTLRERISGVDGAGSGAPTFRDVADVAPEAGRT